MSVGKRIAALRKNHNLTQEQLAEKLGTTRQAVSKWESEKTNPDLDYIVSISKLFQVSTDYLLLGIEVPAAVPESGASRIAHSEVMNRRRRKSFIPVLVAGILVLLLCPLFATVYRNYISEYGPAVTDPYWYLNQWPLLGVKLAGIVLTLIGAVGLAWSHLLKLYRDTCKIWNEHK